MKKFNSVAQKNIIFLLLLSIVVYIVFVPQIYSEGHSELSIFVLSWIGNFIFTIFLILYYKLNHKIFTPFVIIVFFMFMFSWGQCFLWSFGIHTDGQIGTEYLYGAFPTPTYNQIASGQMYTLVCCTFFLLGSSIAMGFTKIISKRENAVSKRAAEINTKSLLLTSKIIGVVVIPLSFYQAFKHILVTYRYGYLAIYYSEYSTSGVLTNVDRLFFPTLIGLLLGSNYKKNVRVFVYIIYFFYSVLYFISGRRGVWLSGFILLVWMHHTYCKKINRKILFKYMVIGLLMLYLLGAMLNLRGIGSAYSSISMSDIINSFSINNFPVVSFLNESGGLMAIIIILLSKGANIWNRYNTFIAAVLGMPATFWLKWFGIDFIYLGNWLSQEILGISWGSGFSLTGECFINGGLYFGPFYMILFGFIIAKITYINKYENNDPLATTLNLIAAQSFMFIFRGDSHSSLKRFFLGFVFIYLIAKLIAAANKHQLKKQITI